MNWYYYIALAAIVSQLLFLFQTYNNHRFAIQKYKRKRLWYRPRAVLIVPCKGLDSAFQENISSFFNLDYENYLLWFVVGDESDPAYGELCELKDRLSQSSKAQDVRVFVAGQGQTCSQKIHNLLYCYEKIGDDIDVLAFADSDVCIHSNSPRLSAPTVEDRRIQRLSLVCPEEKQSCQSGSVGDERQGRPVARQYPFQPSLGWVDGYPR